jgi:hypothetical protein
MRDLSLDMDAASLAKADMPDEAQRLRTTLSQPTVRLSPRQQMYLPALLPWMGSHEGWDDVLDALVAQVESGKVFLHARSWWHLLVWHYKRPRLIDQLHKQSTRWPALHRKQNSLLLSMDRRTIANLPAHLASQAVRQGIPLPDVLRKLGVPPASPLAAGILGCLLSPTAAPWLMAHPQPDLERFLSAHHQTVPIGRLSDALLAPLHQAGLGPGDVRSGALAELVSLLNRHMPKIPHPAWDEMSEQGQEVFRWWRIQREMEGYFREWNAEPDRERFWRRYVHAIQDIHAAQRAGALAIRIGDYWFIEVGRTGFAACGCSNPIWNRLASRFKEATNETGLRSILRGLEDRRSHYRGWQPRFEAWIYQHTKISPSPQRRRY